MQLVVITPEGTVANEVAIVNQLLADSLPRLHLRKPSFSVKEYRDYLASIDRAFHGKIVLCGAFELTGEFEVGGVHLNNAARTDNNVWEQIKGIPPANISASFHSWVEIQTNDFPYGYVFISPVFDSISKRGYKAGIDLAGARETKSMLQSTGKHCPSIIGLGGVVGAQLSTLHRHGFDGAAMLGAIWQTADPVAEFLKARDAINIL